MAAFITYEYLNNVYLRDAKAMKRSRPSVFCLFFSMLQSASDGFNSKTRLYIIIIYLVTVSK